MTRINLVDPNYLTNLHLHAEYRELPRIFSAVLKSPIKGNHIIPDRYVLGEGHTKFFYDKCHWLYYRWLDIIEVLEKRGYNLNPEWKEAVSNNVMYLPLWALGEYSPTPEEIYLNFARLAKRSGFDVVLAELNENL